MDHSSAELRLLLHNFRVAASLTLNKLALKQKHRTLSLLGSVKHAIRSIKCLFKQIFLLRISRLSLVLSCKSVRG